MRDYTRFLEKPSAGRLAPGERFVAGTPAHPRGAITNRALAVAAFGVWGEMFASKGSKPGPVYLGQELPSTLALGVTPLRLLVFGMNVATGRPNKVLYDVPRDAIVAARSRTGRSLGLKKLEVDIVLTNGATLELEISPRARQEWGGTHRSTCDR